ncbi:MAG: hypothetical protein IIA14_06620, partial [SAR324 cluster bacterium]|nr:hypothetical protein [SAR324 cluster bacterium]
MSSWLPNREPCKSFLQLVKRIEAVKRFSLFLIGTFWDRVVCFPPTCLGATVLGLALQNGKPHPHDRMKEVPSEVVDKVIENKPMPDMPRDEQEI